MVNSEHSRGFRRTFDTVVGKVSEPLEERLREVWGPGGEDPDASRQIAQDVLHIACSLILRRKGLSTKQFGFLGDMYDYVFLQDYLGTSVEVHTQRLNQIAIDNQHFWEPPTQSLNLLRGYDTLYGTDTAPTYKDFLLKLVSTTLGRVEQPTASDEILIGEYDWFWTEVATAARAPHLIAELNNAVAEFIKPAREVIRAVEQLSSMDGLLDTDGFIRKTFTNYCAQAILADSTVDDREVELFSDLAPTLNFFGSSGSIDNLKRIFQTAAKNISPSEMPLLVAILDMYDNSLKTDFAQRARSLYFRLANTAFKADLTVCPEEVAWLEQFRKTLYPDSTSEQPASVVQQPKEKQVIGKMTADESIAGLNLLIGLEQVKQDFAQLINFVKVQQLRVEKGLSGSTIPKYFLFYGNPGTGRTSVAWVLANVYREMELLKRGRVVEVNGAELAAGQPNQAALRIREAISSNRANLLFIDEAYALVKEGTPDSPGYHYVEALIKALDDHRNALVIILAGNKEKLDQLVESNPGLKSRFTKSFNFEDYDSEQMTNIFEVYCKGAAFQITSSALELVRSLFEQLYANRGSEFGNAREVRKVFDRILGNQANRIINLNQVNEEILSTITDEDVRPLLNTVENPDDLQKVQMQGQA